MNFEWNPVKAKTNAAKHRVSFVEATEVFGDPLAITVVDPDHSAEEDRLLIFGQTRMHRHLVVAFTDNDFTIRLISARVMTSLERVAYEQE